MNDPRDERDPWRDAWDQLEAPADLWSREDRDPAARACDEWVRGAWAAVQPELPLARPGSGPPSQLAFRGPSIRTRALRRVLPFAAAAAALFLWQVSVSTRTERLPDLDEPALEVALVQPSPPVIRPRITANGAIEARSGNVRLILLPETRPTESHPEK